MLRLLAADGEKSVAKISPLQRVLNGLWTAGEGLSRVEQGEAVIADLVADRALVFRDLYESQNEVAQRLLSQIVAARFALSPRAPESFI